MKPRREGQTGGQETTCCYQSPRRESRDICKTEFGTYRRHSTVVGVDRSMTMKRRRYLGLAIAALTGGCQSAESGNRAGNESRDTSQPDELSVSSNRHNKRSNALTEEVHEVTMEFDPSETVDTVSVGNRDLVENPSNNRPHEVVIWNAGDEAQTVSLTIVQSFLDEEASEVTEQSRHEIPADQALQLRLNRPEDYEITIGTSASDEDLRYEIRSEEFDCNWTTKNVRLSEAGSFSSFEFSTSIACDESET